MPSLFDVLCEIVQLQANAHAQSVGRKRPPEIALCTQKRMNVLKGPFSRLADRSWPLQAKSEFIYIASGFRMAYVESFGIEVRDLDCIQRGLLVQTSTDSSVSKSVAQAVKRGAEAAFAAQLNVAKVTAQLESTRDEVPSDEIAGPVLALLSDSKFTASIEFTMDATLGGFSEYASKLVVAVMKEYLLRVIAADEKQLQLVAFNPAKFLAEGIEDRVRPIGDLLETLSHGILLCQHTSKPSTYVVLCGD